MAQDYGTPGRDEAKTKRFGFAPSLVFGLGTPTRASFNYLYVDQKNRPDGGVSTYGLPGYIGAVGPAVDRSNYYGSLNDFDDVTLHMFTAKVEHNFSPTTILRNTSRLGSTEQDYVLTGINGGSMTRLPPSAPRGAQPPVSPSANHPHQPDHLSTEFATGASTSLSTGSSHLRGANQRQSLVA